MDSTEAQVSVNATPAFHHIEVLYERDRMPETFELEHEDHVELRKPDLVVG